MIEGCGIIIKKYGDGFYDLLRKRKPSENSKCYGNNGNRRHVFQSRFSAKDDAGFAGGADYRRSPARGNKEICQIKHIVIQIQMY